MPKEIANGRPDVPIARLAARQHGVVSVQQLYAAGLLPSGISDRVRAGRLHRVHRGVYAVGHSNIGNEGRWMAAVLACGEGAVLSYRSVAELWGMIRPARRPSDPGGRGDRAVDVTVPGAAGRARRTGIQVHRSHTLPQPI